MNPATTLSIGRMCLKDGRTLAWAEYGDPHGVPVFYFHGGGGSYLEGACFHREAQSNGVRLIAPSRPGGLGSTPKPGFHPLDFAADCVELATHLGVKQFVTTGNSNGGLFTMAVAFALPEQVIGAAPINSTSPVWDTAKTSLSLKFLMRLVQWFPGLWIRTMKADFRRGGKLTALPADVEPEIRNLFADNISAVTAESFALEARIATQPWGFDHRAIRCPVRILSGEGDISRHYGDTWARELCDGTHLVVPGAHVPISPETRRTIATTWRLLSGA